MTTRAVGSGSFGEVIAEVPFTCPSLSMGKAEDVLRARRLREQEEAEQERKRLLDERVREPTVAADPSQVRPEPTLKEQVHLAAIDAMQRIERSGYMYGELLKLPAIWRRNATREVAAWHIYTYRGDGERLIRGDLVKYSIEDSFYLLTKGKILISGNEKHTNSFVLTRETRIEDSILKILLERLNRFAIDAETDDLETDDLETDSGLSS